MYCSGPTRPVRRLSSSLNYPNPNTCAAGAGKAGPAGAGGCGAAAERGTEGSTGQQPGHAPVGGSTEIDSFYILYGNQSLLAQCFQLFLVFILARFRLIIIFD